MMKNMRLFILTLLLIVALSLSACTAALPGALTTFNDLLPGHGATAQAVATPAMAPTAPAVVAAPAEVAATGDLQATLEQIYQSVSPSVVNIRVMHKETVHAQSIPEIPGFPLMPGFPFFQPQAPQEQPQTPQRPRYSVALGSGFVWDDQGRIVTNNHVVDGADKIAVTFSDGVTVPATVVGRDPDSDLAVIKVDPKLPELHPVTVADSTEVKVGQFTVAIGDPFGLQGTMTFGIVSALGRTLPTSAKNTLSNGPVYTIPDIIQTDAPVNPGNSGGVLLDLQGRVIGVPSAIESPVRGSSGIGFAIPSIIVQRVVPALIKTGHVEHPWVGISGMTLTPDMAKAMNLPATQRGALVVDVTQGSPADKANLRGSGKQVSIEGQQVRVGGDVIVAIDNQPVTRFEDLTTYLARHTDVGQTVQLKVIRSGKEITLPLKLAARPSPEKKTAEAQQPEAKSSNAWLGINGITLTPKLAQAMNLAADQKGVLIENVATGSPADQAGLEGSYKAVTIDGQRVAVGGDVIVAANDQPVQSMENLVGAVQSLKPGDTMALTILRDGEQMQLSVTLAARPTQTP